MDLLCAERLSCTPEDHRVEAERAGERYPLDLLKERIVDVSSDVMKALGQLRSNNVKNRVFAFLSGSLVVECKDGGGVCAALSSMAKAGIAEDLGGFFYVPYTALSDRLIEYLPVEEEAQPIKRPYLASVSGLGGGEPIESFSTYINSAGYFLGGKIEKIISKITFIPQLINKYNTQIDILVRFQNKYILGVKYIDIRKTVHMGFSAIDDYLKYGLDYAVLLHPYIEHKVHRYVANRINELDISPSGYLVLDIVNEILYIYKFPKYNIYLSRYISAHSQAMAIRSYIESL